MEKIRKGKRKFERKTKRCKLCREEMDVTEELKIVGLLHALNKVSVRRYIYIYIYIYIYMYVYLYIS